MKKVYIVVGLCLLLGAYLWMASVKPKREIALDTATQKAVDSNTAFALDLFKVLRRQDGNLIFSPFSVSSALQLVSLGADGTTKSELAKVLHLDALRDSHLEANGNLMQYMQSANYDVNYELSVANSLWLDKNYPFHQYFFSQATKYFDASIYQEDFKDANVVAQRINGWADEQTRGMIPEVITAADINPATRLFILNAVYFKGDWLEKFDPDNSKEEAFYLGTEKSVQSLLMFQHEEFRMLVKDKFQILELPYSNDMSMIIFLPNAHDGLEALEKQFNQENLDTWLGELAATYPSFFDVWIPKFESKSSLDLIPALRGLGMRAVFSEFADFSQLTPHEKLFIDVIRHDAVIKVNEEGTEAAAVTTVVIDETALKEEEPLEFRADHPFIYMIRDNSTGTILFLGRLADPTR